MLKSAEDKALLTRYSSFEVVPQILKKIVTLLLKSERLKRLLYYSDPKALKLPKLTPAQSLQVLEEQIKIVPRVEINEDSKPVVLISLTDFIPEEGITVFRTMVLNIDVICTYDLWNLDNFKLRPYAIAGEIDALIGKGSELGVGIGDFLSGKSFNINPYTGGVNIKYLIETSKDNIKLYPDED